MEALRDRMIEFYRQSLERCSDHRGRVRVIKSNIALSSDSNVNWLQSVRERLQILESVGHIVSSEDKNRTRRSILDLAIQSKRIKFSVTAMCTSL